MRKSILPARLLEIQTEFSQEFSYWKILRLLAMAAILLGVLFRFMYLDQKVYWADEAFTSLRVAGYTVQEVAHDLYGNRPISVAAFQQYQQLNAEKQVADTVNGLISEEPQLTPLYFVALRFWAQQFGTSVAAIRSFSAVLSLGAIGAMYWLCLTLFSSRLAAWVGAALFAVSPFHVLYAQEARPYSLLTLIILGSSICCLRALHSPIKQRRWGLYSATVAIGLYSHLFSGLAFLAHGIYLFGLSRFRLSKSMWAYLSACVLGVVAFLPWAIAIGANRQQAETMTSWADEKFSTLDLIRVWIGNLSRLCFDLGISASTTPAHILWLNAIPVLLFFLLFVYALYFLYKRTAAPIYGFVFSLIGPTVVLLWLPDLISGGRQSTAPRYSIALFIGIQLALTYLFSSKLADLAPQPALKRPSGTHPRTAARFSSPHNLLWSLVLAATFACNLISCTASLPATVWWHKSPSYTRHIPTAATVINQTEAPLLIVIPEVDGDLMRVESLAYALNPNVQLQFLPPNSSLPPALRSNTLIYLPFLPSSTAIDNLQRSSPLNRLVSLPGTDHMLFQLKPKIKSS